MGMRKLVRTPSQRTSPWEARAAPTIPPMSAWEAEDGIPPVPGKKVPDDRTAERCEKHGKAVGTVDGVDEVLPDRARHAFAEEGTQQGHHSGQGNRNPRGESLRHNGGDNRVRGVVETVGEGEE